MRVESKIPVDDILQLALEIVPFFLSHNAEADAVDLLLELESINKIIPFVDENTFVRVCLYMVSCVHYLPPPDDESFLRTTHAIYRKVNKLPEALILSLRLNDKQWIKDDYDACTDPLLRKQMAFLLARQAISITSIDEVEQEILCNLKLSEHFLSLGRELGISDPKTPEDIYKTHLETRSTFSIDSSRQNLASSFVNAFVNAGFAKDKLMLVDDSQWVYKTKEHAMASATASIGALMLWDVEGGLTQIDKYLYNSDESIQAGAMLAIGIVHANVKNESDPALALLSEHLNSEKPLVRLMAITGLGLAYAGSENEAVYELLSPLIKDTQEVSCTAALALGLVFVGSCHGDLSSTILQNLLEMPIPCDKTRFMALGLALLYLGKQEMCDATLETLRVVDAPISKTFQVLLEICAYAGTGNVLKVQSLLQLCSDHLKENDDWQAFAVLGVALIAMGDDLGNEMALRIFKHFVHYSEPIVRRSVPLAIALLYASNPVLSVMDTLSKYSHDSDQDVAISAIFAMGIIGAGTNNARLAQMLRQLASYYHKNSDCLFFVRIAQGLIHMGKGTLTINPFHTNRMLMSRVGVAGLLTVLVSMTDAKRLILGNSHWLLYHLVSAMYPRFLITLDQELKPKPVSARVGMAVDVVGQAGRPKTITGFQTHTTPVLMAHTDRAELGSDECTFLTVHQFKLFFFFRS
ncbi:proteasome regulatory particle base subunit [Coelomomyces lativittatus]|nr:proteasome regulatory particle base subunit [Coelomomyces lativittatus]